MTSNIRRRSSVVNGVFTLELEPPLAVLAKQSLQDQNDDDGAEGVDPVRVGGLFQRRPDHRMLIPLSSADIAVSSRYFNVDEAPRCVFRVDEVTDFRSIPPWSRHREY